MDRAADPRKDFPRFSAGHYREVAQIPADNVRISPMDQMSQQTDVQVREVLEEAAKSSATAPKGSPRQQIGDLYAAGTNESRLEKLGSSPITDEFERIDAIEDAKGIAREIGRLELLTNSPVMIGATVTPDINDRSRYSLVIGDGELGLKNYQGYLLESSASIRAAYLKYIADTLIIAGVSERNARRRADTVLSVETRIARVPQSPVDSADPNKRYVRMNYEALKALTPTFPWDNYFDAVGVKTPREVLAVEVSRRSRFAVSQV